MRVLLFAFLVCGFCSGCGSSPSSNPQDPQASTNSGQTGKKPSGLQAAETAQECWVSNTVAEPPLPSEDALDEWIGTFGDATFEDNWDENWAKEVEKYEAYLEANRNVMNSSYRLAYIQMLSALQKKDEAAAYAMMLHIAKNVALTPRDFKSVERILDRMKSLEPQEMKDVRDLNPFNED